MNSNLVSLIVLLLVGVSGNLLGQSLSSTDGQAVKTELNTELFQKLETLAQWCDANKLSPEAEETRSYKIDRDPKRQYIFLPPTTGRPDPEMLDTQVQQQWLQRLSEILNPHAEELFQRARTAAREKDSATAYQLLNEVLHFNPDHSEVRKILGYRKSDDGWRRDSTYRRARPASRKHELMEWPARSYTLQTSAHFSIASKATPEQTEELAEHMERWYHVWRQVFFEFWNRPESVERWIEGKGKRSRSRKKFDIVFFASRDQYIAELKQRVPGIEGSTGYYSDRLKTAFFFYEKDDASIRNTWKHEATHQWFQESIKARISPFEDNYLWLGEGIAMYFESLVPTSFGFELGGFEASRLQYARRRVHEGFYLPLKTASEMSLREMQTNPDVKKLYSQAAGVTQMLMCQRGARDRKQLVEFLKLIYRGKLKPDSFETIIGRNFATLDDEYFAFLNVDAKEFQYLSAPERLTELTLSKTRLDAAAFMTLGRCKNLTWLDLSNNEIKGDWMGQLAGCVKLRRLFLNDCEIDGIAAQQIRKIPGLIELDLTMARIAPDDIELIESETLQTIRLNGTSINDRGISALAKLRSLKLIEVEGTRISADVVSQLEAQHRQLKIKR